MFYQKPAAFDDALPTRTASSVFFFQNQNTRLGRREVRFLCILAYWKMHSCSWQEGSVCKYVYQDIPMTTGMNKSSNIVITSSQYVCNGGRSTVLRFILN